MPSGGRLGGRSPGGCDTRPSARSNGATGARLPRTSVEKLFASVDRHPRALRIVYNYPAEHRFLVTSDRVRVIDAVPGTWPRRSLTTPKTILTYLVLPSDGDAAAELVRQFPPRLRGAERWLEPYDPGFGFEKPERLGGKVAR